MREPQFDPRTGQPRRRSSPWVTVLIVLGACGGISLAGVAILAAIMFPVFAQARDAARRASCMSNVKMMSVGLLMYANDNDDRLPRGKVWQDSITSYLPPEAKDFCASRPQSTPGYAYSQRLSGESLSKLSSPETEPMLFESSLGQRNGNDLLQSFVTPHADKGVVSYVDGAAAPVASAPKASPPGNPL